MQVQLLNDQDTYRQRTTSRLLTAQLLVKGMDGY